jgi:probable phosphoglycerate mutase
LLYSEIAARYPLYFVAWQARNIDANLLPPGKTRVNRSALFFFDRVTTAIMAHARYLGQTLALVAHAACSNVTALGLKRNTPRDLRV